MGGDHLAAAFRDLRNRRLHIAVERVEFGQIAAGIIAVDPAARGIGASRRVPDVGQIDFGVGGRLPGVWIGVRAELAGGDALGGGDHGALAACGLYEPRQPALQPETVDDHELCIRNLLGVRRRRRIDMHVAIGTDQGRHADALAPDISREIAEDRKAGDDIQTIFRARGSSRCHQRQNNEPQSKTPHRAQISLFEHDLSEKWFPLFRIMFYASRWRPGNICRNRPLTLPNSTDPTYSTAATRMIAGPDGTLV